MSKQVLNYNCYPLQPIFVFQPFLEKRYDDKDLNRRIFITLHHDGELILVVGSKPTKLLHQAEYPILTFLFSFQEYVCMYVNNLRRMRQNTLTI